jgi:ubiquinone/menaquinone biosynthesis C-methylase UbiE
MDYENETLNAYRTADRALQYELYHSRWWTWGHLATWFEQRAIARELNRYEWSALDMVLDIPCGTGVLWSLLRQFPFRLVASDISAEMMSIGQKEHSLMHSTTVVQADITETPFKRETFSCVLTIGFMHRVPLQIKRDALKEIARLSKRVVIVSCSIDTRLQRWKHTALRFVRRGHVPAPFPTHLTEMIDLCNSEGFRVVRNLSVIPFLSSHVILVLEKIS